MKKTLERVYMAIIFIFMYAPIATMIVLSFNASRSRAKWGGFTLQWYVSLFSDNAILNALFNTLLIALIATVVSTIIGTVTCVALMGMGKRSRRIIMGITNIPMINADIVTGISLMLLFRALHFQQGFVTVLLAHITFDIPYVMLSVMPRMKTINLSVYEAAQDLGASPFYAFRRTVLPDLAPAITSGALMAFTMSLDDFIITYFTKGSGFDTLSTRIYSEVRKGIQPEIYALSALIFIVVLLLLFTSDRIRKNGSHVREKATEISGSRRPGHHGSKKGMYIGLGVVTAALCVFLVFLGKKASGGSNKLYVYNWGEYIDPEVITSFEEETGIQVIYDTFDSNEIMYAKLAQDLSQYDVICPSDYMISKMVEENMLYPLDWDALPNAKENIGQQYYESSRAFDPENKYTVPYCWGTVGILYNRTMVDDPVNSWNILWNEKYKGQILMQDSVRDAFMVALAKDGYSINSTDPDELRQAADDLIAQKPLVQAYVIDQVRDKMIGNEAALGVIYSGEAIYTKRENPDLEYVVPDEGSNVWIDAWAVSAGARNKENAMKWIDYMCRSEIALKNFEYITYSTPNTAARDMIEDEDIRNSEVAFPPDSVLQRCETYSYLGQDAEKLYNDYWKEVKGGD